MALPKTPIKVALDWTPNTIHSGLYLAKEGGIYDKQGLDVQLLPPDAEYTKTPAKRLEDGDVDLAICPSESCIAYAHSGKMKLQAIYAILQRDASAIASTNVSKISQLGEGKVYGSYNARYEDHIVRAMVEKDGGNAGGMKIEREQSKLGMFEAVKRGKMDATWIFLPWEGVEAELNNVKLHTFKPEDYSVPYGYSPVIAVNAASTRLTRDDLWNFVAATIDGYNHAIYNVDEAIQVLGKYCVPQRSDEFLRRSQKAINEYYSDGSTLGRMSATKWRIWVEWLRSRGLLEGAKIDAEQLFKNP
ncbi:NMT1/THI5 like [Teratosphaeria destructans]|uniref:4-amino-5-hydroxymethyl-2-methylpyrimidine phosphate synthase n=1 Tax=Teratosphaeria destructans TaxID=418781 RepID=A0A9W7SJP1_9PEZI|nr:NMT1/THI5 like [Teratosphaeria destructans]